MKLLWLASWYPNKLTPYNGDFIMRHAEAAGIFDDITVIHVVRDIKGEITQDVHIEKVIKGRLEEWIIYYYSNATIPLVQKLVSAMRFRKVFRNAIKSCIQEKGKPDLVHIHVGMNAGLLAGWLKREYQIPYVVSEHWTGFLDEATDRFEHLPSYIRRSWKRIGNSADAVHFVSDHLRKNYLKKINCQSTIVIPNVVNTSIFKPAHERPGAEPVFIHISGMDERKNPEHMLAAFSIVRKEFPAARLKIFGSRRQEIISILQELELTDFVEIHEEVSQEVLAFHTRQSIASILYSDCETFGCVIIEANACGIPVIVSDIPVFHETVEDNVNGLFVPPRQPGKLAEKMIEMIHRNTLFDHASIAARAKSRYSYVIVGKQISLWYRSVLGKY